MVKTVIQRMILIVALRVKLLFMLLQLPVKKSSPFVTHSLVKASDVFLLFPLFFVPLEDGESVVVEITAIDAGMAMGCRWAMGIGDAVGDTVGRFGNSRMGGE